MKIIIPASGTGERFKKVGYKETKPLIQVTENKKIIDYVIECFDKNDEFIVITSSETYNEMQKYLITKKIKFTHLLYSGDKLGPVGCIQGCKSELNEYISDEDEVIVSYCDFGMKWDYQNFLKFIDIYKPDGAIPCYSGYHPHLVPKENNYAACKILDDSNIIYSVKEKYESEDKFSEFWSPGVYYFKSFNILKTAFNKIIEAKDTLNGEYYVSLVYNYMKDLDIRLYDEVTKFFQFGTPSDFEYAKDKINMLKNLKNNYAEIKNTIILSAGRGERFFNLGFNQPKQFLPLNGKDIISNIVDTFEDVKTHISCIGAEDHKLFWENEKYEVSYVPPNKLGGAYSYKKGAANKTGETLIIPCDLIAKHITDKFLEIKNTADVIIFTAKPSEFSLNNPNSFAWVIGENNEVKRISIKERENSNANQMVLIGSFWVKENEFLLKEIQEIFDKKFTINGEYYLDNAFKNMIEKNTVNYIKLEEYFSLGTPEEYKESKYWMENN